MRRMPHIPTETSILPARIAFDVQNRQKKRKRASLAHAGEPIWLSGWGRVFIAEWSEFASQQAFGFLTNTCPCSARQSGAEQGNQTDLV